MLDVLSLIFNYVNDGKTYKSILYSSKLFYDIMTYYHSRKRYQVYNQLWSIINFYPDEQWNWNSITSNKNTTINIIKTNKIWNLDALSSNPNITIDFIKEHLDRNWNC